MRPRAKAAAAAVLLLALLAWTTLTPSPSRATDPDLCDNWSDLYQQSGLTYHYESATECDEHWNGMALMAVRGRLVDGRGLIDGFLGPAYAFNTTGVSKDGTTRLSSGSCYLNVGVHGAGTIKGSVGWQWPPVQAEEVHWLAITLSPFRCP